jgi:hypothetical protein
MLLAIFCLLVLPSSASAQDGSSRASVSVGPERPDPQRVALAAKESAQGEPSCALVPFQASPFPYRGLLPDQESPFLDAVDGSRRGHTAPRGGIYWEDETYSDRRVLLCIPPGFDIQLPALIVVYFHGNVSTLERDVRERQQVPQQVAASGLNAVLVAPQLAVDALDSSAGRFWQPGVFAEFLHEAAAQLAKLYGNTSARQAFDRAPVVIVAYSGGYLPAAFSVAVGAAEERVRGMVLLDALYGEQEKLADWIARRQRKAFFLSAYSDSARADNAALQDLLAERQVSFRKSPAVPLVPGSVSFLDVGPEVAHDSFVNRAWVDDPLQWVLARIPGFERPAD